ncbi:MAG: Hsp20/alpha crystallin family protein [bacterium]
MTYWNSFRELDELRREMDRVFGSLGTWDLPFSRISFLPGKAARSYPLVNLNEDKDAYYVQALAPGVNPETLNISVTGNALTIAGEKNGSGTNVKPEAFHRSERAVGTFVRTVELPDEVDDTKIKADYKNGLLLVTLPKTEKAKPKQIVVNIG